MYFTRIYCITHSIKKKEKNNPLSINSLNFASKFFLKTNSINVLTYK